MKRLSRNAKRIIIQDHDIEALSAVVCTLRQENKDLRDELDDVLGGLDVQFTPPAP
jgi:hypothetical protein